VHIYDTSLAVCPVIRKKTWSEVWSKDKRQGNTGRTELVG